MLNNEESSAVSCTDHERIKTSVRDCAPVFTADVHKDWSITGVVVIVYPEALFVSSIILHVEMVNLVVKGLLNEGVDVNLG